MKKLKEEVLQAYQKGDIAQLYMLEQRAQDTLQEEELSGFYANILELAMERLTEILEAKVRLQMQEVQDFATLRALYEYAMEHYSAGALEDAAALFEILTGISDDADFSKAMQVHQKAAQKKISLDDFINTIADIKQFETQNIFYLNSFTKEAQKLLKDEANRP
jgi:Cft2 family RNA processing exonuclease